jgi:hypothetical protein
VMRGRAAAQSGRRQPFSTSDRRATGQSAGRGRNG